MPTATMKLKCRVSFQTKTIHMIASNHPFSPVVTDLVRNMQAPISGLVLHVILSRFLIQKAWSWLIPTFSWGTPALSKWEGKYFNEKVPSASTLHLAMPCCKWFSVRGKCPLWISRPLTGEATKKLSARTWFSFVLYWRWAPRWTAS